MKWIEVSKRTPKLADQYLVYWQGETKRDVSSFGLLWFEGRIWHDDDEEEFETPTHWMPLPPPPKEMK